VPAANWPKAYLSWQVPNQSLEVMTVTAGPLDVVPVRSGEIRTLAFSFDGKVLASGTTNGSIFLVNMNPAGVADEFCLIRGHSIGVESIAFSPDGKRLASGGWDHNVKLWDLSQGVSSIKNLWSWEGTSQGGRPVAFSPDGTRVALGSFDGFLTILTATTGRQYWATPLPRRTVNGVAFSPDGKLIAIALGDDVKATFAQPANQNGELQIWDEFTHALRFRSGGLKGACNSVAFSPDGTLLAATCNDGKTRVYDVSSFREKFVLHGGASMAGLVFRPDGKLLATSTVGGHVIFWDLATQDRRAVFQQIQNEQSPALAFSPDGGILAAGRADGSIELWDAKEPAAREN
jgi:WD40 repeat protein